MDKLPDCLKCKIKDYNRNRLPSSLQFEIKVTQMLRVARQERARWFARHCKGKLIFHEGKMCVQSLDESGTFIFNVL